MKHSDETWTSGGTWSENGGTWSENGGTWSERGTK